MTGDQQPQEDILMDNETTEPEQEEMENDTPINKTLLDENSMMHFKAPRAEQQAMKVNKPTKK